MWNCHPPCFLRTVACVVVAAAAAGKTVVVDVVAVVVFVGAAGGLDVVAFGCDGGCSVVADDDSGLSGLSSFGGGVVVVAVDGNRVAAEYCTDCCDPQSESLLDWTADCQLANEVQHLQEWKHKVDLSSVLSADNICPVLSVIASCAQKEQK